MAEAAPMTRVSPTTGRAEPVLTQGNEEVSVIWVPATATAIVPPPPGAEPRAVPPTTTREAMAASAVAKAEGSIAAVMATAEAAPPSARIDKVEAAVGELE